MKRTHRAGALSAAAGLVLAGTTGAFAAAAEGGTDAAPPAFAPEPVENFQLFGRLDSWRAIDQDTLIVWATAFRPYLIVLARPSPDLRFAQVIGVSSTVGRVHSSLDDVRVNGWIYPIEAIYRLTPSQARNWDRSQVVGIG